MYSSSKEDGPPPPDTGKLIRIGVVALIAIVIFVMISNQAVTLSLNITEFEDKFTKPLQYSVLSAVILSVIALTRITKRSSITWFGISTAISFLNRGSSREPFSSSITSFRDYKLSIPHFVIWQITKILLFGAFFSNIMFGFAVMYLADGNVLGISNIPTLFSLPFVTPPTDPLYASETVVPMIPALLIFIPPLLGVIGLRLTLYVGLHNIIKVITSYLHDSSEGKPKFLNYFSTIEAILGIGIIWVGFNMFFTNDIDYNTRYAIAGTFVIGFVLIAFSIIDRIRSKVLTHMLKRDVYIRILTVIVIAITVAALMSVNDSIADAKKIEYLGPYTAQQIGVNRYLAELDEIKEVTHDVQLESISPNSINAYINQNSDVLDVIRVWDWQASFAKLKPEIGLIPYVDFEDNDILRFNDTLFWTASMKPILPSAVAVEDRWYNEHLVYTHVPKGFLTIDATKGQIVDSGDFFQQREIYYGEGGLLAETWSAYPISRGSETDELNNAFYSGTGGIDVPPPLSYIFEPNFLLSYPGDSVHIMRYKDVNERMQFLYPYFLYNLFGKELDSFPVSDGEKTYWLMPLIIGFNANDVPWSVGTPYLRLVGYALIDTYDGDISLIQYGDDFFSKMFRSQYEKHYIETPEWIKDQIRYPQELFNWKTDRYNTYHITDVDTFIQANEFYEIPRGLDTYYIEAKPPGFDKPNFLGLLSLELKGSQGRNLAGYMIVENDFESLGDMQFYEIPLNSTTKLIGPTAVREALDRDPDFAQLKTLLRNPRIGDNILYRVGEQDVYFIPVYTAGAGGVVAQLGTIAAVGAAFTGEYYVGLGDTQEKAFEAYLQKLSGVTTISVSTNGDFIEFDKNERIQVIKTIVNDLEIELLTPTDIQIPLSFKEGEISFFTDTDKEDTEKLVFEFLETFVLSKSNRVLMWEVDDIVNLGTIIIVQDIPEMHYISIEVGK